MQDRCARAIEEHRVANRSYLDEGVRLLELAQNAHELFRKQEPREKRRLLGFVVSNCTGKGGEPTADSASGELVSGERDKSRELKCGSPGRTRTSDKAVNSRLLYQLSYRGTPMNDAL